MILDSLFFVKRFLEVYLGNNILRMYSKNTISKPGVGGPSAPGALRAPLSRCFVNDIISRNE